jgi:hypothetical protein
MKLLIFVLFAYVVLGLSATALAQTNSRHFEGSTLENVGKYDTEQVREFLNRLKAKSPGLYEIIMKVKKSSPKQAELLISQKMLLEEAGLLIAKGEETIKTDTSVEMNNIGSYNNEPPKGIIKIKINDRKVSKEK